MSEVDAAAYRTGSRLAYLMSVITAAILVIMLVWAKFATLEEVTRGMGQVIPSTHVQVIQNLEGGIVDELFVNENQLVEKDDLLLRLRNSLSASQYQEALRRSEEHRAAIIRLSAESKDEKPVFTDVIGIPEETQSTQMAIYQARQEKLRSELQIFESQALQKKQEIQELQGKNGSCRRA